MGQPPTSLIQAVRRRPLLTAALVVMLLLRAALPYTLERLVETRGADAAGLAIDVGDVDLGLLRGRIALRDVAIAPADAARDAEGKLVADDAVVGWRSLRINLGWLALLGRTIRLSDIELRGPRVSVERTETGGINLVELFAGTPQEEEALDPEEEEAASAWRFAADRVSIRNGVVSFLDRSVAEGRPLEVEVDAIDLEALAWPLDRSPDGSRFDLDLVVDGATLALDGSATERDGELDVEATLDAANLRLIGVRAYTGALGWADLRGQLDAQLTYRLVGDHTHSVEGSMAVRDALVTVPERDDAPLSWRRLAVDGADVDLIAKRAALASLTLEGASLFVDPASPSVSPLVPRASEEPAVEVQSGGIADGDGGPGPEELAAGDAGTGDTGPEDVAAEAEADADGATGSDAEATQPAPDSAPWSVAVDELRVEELELRVATRGEPLSLSLDLEASDLDSASDAVSPLSLHVAQGDGHLEVDAELRLQPPAARATLTWKDLDLAALAAAVPDQTVRSLKSAKTSGRLGVLAGLAPVDADTVGSADGYDARDVVVDGKASIAGLDFSIDEPEPFHAAWDDVAIELARLQLAGVLTAKDAAIDGAAAAPPRRTLVRLTRLGVTAPRVRMTIPAAQSASPTVDADAAPSSQPNNDADGALELLIDDLAITDARIVYEDRSLPKPFKGELTADELRARSLRWPQPRALGLSGRGSALGAGRWQLAGELTPEKGRVDLELDGLPLAPLTPLSNDAAGIVLRQGGASLKTKLRLSGKDVDSDNQLVLHELGVGGAEGEQQFASTFGIPLSLAIALLKGPGGDISLSLPVSVTRGQTTAGITSAVTAVLRQAIVGAVTSPLKLVGAVVMSGGSVSEFSVQPIAFQAGSATLADGTDKGISALAGLVAVRPAMAVELAALISQEDVAVLKEARVREALDGNASLAEGSPEPSWLARRRLRAHLEAKLAGEAEALDDDDRALLDALIAAQPAPPAAMRTLAEARAKAAEAALREAASLGAGQVRTAALPDPLSPTDGPPRVEVSFIAAN